MSDDFFDTVNGIAAESRVAAEEANAAADLLEREAARISKALDLGDKLAAFVVERAQSETLSTHVEISFEPDAAAMIANMADAYQRARNANP